MKNNFEKLVGRTIDQNERDTRRSQTIETGTMSTFGWRVWELTHELFHIHNAIVGHGASEFRTIPLMTGDGKPTGFFGVEVPEMPNPWDWWADQWIVTEHHHDKRTATLLAKIAEKGGDDLVCELLHECDRQRSRLEEVDAQKLRRDGWVI